MTELLWLIMMMVVIFRTKKVRELSGKKSLKSPSFQTQYFPRFMSKGLSFSFFYLSVSFCENQLIFLRSKMQLYLNVHIPRVNVIKLFLFVADKGDK
jgi:hypothetical protein